MKPKGRQPAQGGPHKTGRIRSVERLVWISFAVLPVVVGVGILWRLSYWQVWCLVIGLSCFVLGWMVWRHGIIGYSHEEGFDPHTGQVRPPTTTVVRAPLPRVLAPLIAILGLVFLLAGTRTPLGAVLFVPALAGIGLWYLAKGAWEFLSTIIVWAAFVVGMVLAFREGLLRRDREALATGGCFVGLLAVGAAVNYVFYLIDEALWRQTWSDFLEPVRVLVRLFT